MAFDDSPTKNVDGLRSFSNRKGGGCVVEQARMYDRSISEGDQPASELKYQIPALQILQLRDLFSRFRTAAAVEVIITIDPSGKVPRHPKPPM